MYTRQVSQLILCTLLLLLTAIPSVSTPRPQISPDPSAVAAPASPADQTPAGDTDASKQPAPPAAADAATPAAPAPSPSDHQRHVLGYYTVDYPGDTAASRSFRNFSRQIDSIASFSFCVDGNGNLASTAPREGAELARAEGSTALALIHNYNNGGFDAAAAHKLLTNPASRQRLIENTARVLQKYGYRGVNVDLENIPPADRRYYSLLIQEFKQTLAPSGYLTTVSIPAKTHDDRWNPWSGGFDYRTIGKYADQVQIMTYDEHSLGNAPGPVASLPWVEQVVRYAVQLIPAEKILLGIATYGYDWSAAGSRMIPASDIEVLTNKYGARPRWSNTDSVPYLYYYKDGIRHEVWYENAASTSLKLDLVNKYGLMGVGIWRLGHEEESFWQAVAEKLQ